MDNKCIDVYSRHLPTPKIEDPFANRQKKIIIICFIKDQVQNQERVLAL